MPAGQLAFCDEAHAVCAAAPAPADVAEAEKVKGAQALHTTSDVFVPSAAKYVPAGQEVLHGEQPPLLFVKVPGAVHAGCDSALVAKRSSASARRARRAAIGAAEARRLPHTALVRTGCPSRARPLSREGQRRG